MPDTGNVKDCFEVPLTNFSIFTLKNVTWRTYLISFTVQDCFLFRFVCIELVSLIWFLQFWVAIYVYGTMIKLVHFDKEVKANVFRHSLWDYSKRFHCSFQWHLTPRVTLSIKTCIGGHPVLSGHYSIAQGCPLNTGFTVFFVFSSFYSKFVLSMLHEWFQCCWSWSAYSEESRSKAEGSNSQPWKNYLHWNELRGPLPWTECSNTHRTHSFQQV